MNQEKFLAGAGVMHEALNDTTNLPIPGCNCADCAAVKERDGERRARIDDVKTFGATISMLRAELGMLRELNAILVLREQGARCQNNELQAANDNLFKVARKHCAENQELKKKLTFEQFEAACLERCKAFPDHGKGIEHWATAVAGEIGEFCNVVKKIERGDTITADEAGRELADAVAYSVIAAEALGLSWEKIVKAKFNEVSDRIGSAIKL